MVGCCSWLGIPQLILSHDSHFHSAGTSLLPPSPSSPCLPYSASPGAFSSGDEVARSV